MQVKTGKKKESGGERRYPMIFEKIRKQKVGGADSEYRVEDKSKIKDDDRIVCIYTERQGDQSAGEEKVGVGKSVLIWSKKSAVVKRLMEKNVLLDLPDDVGDQTSVVSVRQGIF